MDTITSTATKAVSGTKLFIATMALFGAGAVALATVPLANFWSGAVDPDAKTTYDSNQLFVKSTTKYNGGSKTDYCYTFPSTGKTYLMEGINRNGSFATWQKNCAELNNTKPGSNFKCVEGACVNSAAVQSAKLTVMKGVSDSIKIINGENKVGKFVLVTSGAEVKVNKITFTYLYTTPTGTLELNNWNLRDNYGNLIGTNGTVVGTQIVFENLNLIIPQNNTGTLELSVTFNGVTSEPGYTFTPGILSIEAVNSADEQTVQVINVPMWGNTLSN